MIKTTRNKIMNDDKIIYDITVFKDSSVINKYVANSKEEILKEMKKVIEENKEFDEILIFELIMD
jgi:hypothetical protein